MAKTLRIFISSPGDVQEERLRAHLVIQKLARDYARFFKLEPYLWEYEPMLASGHFQDAIEPPSATDIVILVVYSRLGTALPERTRTREYRGLDGRVPVTGTEWEFEEALEAHRTRGAPDLLAYRKLGDPQASLADAGKRAEQERQWTALESFWARHFEGGGVFLAGSSKFRSLEEFDAKLEADLVRLIEARIAGDFRQEAGGEDATWLHGSPFPGLSAYGFGDAPIFFGRDAQIREASTRLQGAARAGAAFLLVLGASGSGKSSLARAGILPALFAAKAVPNVGVWRRAILRPGEGGDEPVLGLAKALVAGDAGAGEGLPELLGPGMGPETLAAHLQSAPDDPSFPFRQALAKVADAARAKGGLLPHEEGRLVILVDQLEELFTRDIDPARRALFVRILAGLARSGAVWIVATMRNDLWHRAAEIPQLVELVESGARLDLPAPGGAEIIEIVRRPAAAAGILFEKDAESGVGLDAVVSRAASEEPGALPLLSVMLQSLFQRDIVEAGGHALTFASYRKLGELHGAIAQRADEALAALRLHDPEAADALPRVLRALVTASGDGTATSRPARLDAFAPGGPEARLAAAFLAPDTRLLVASEAQGGAEIRLAHEALLENWPAAREQIETDRRDLQTRARLEVLERRWSQAGTPAERKRALLTSLNLAEGVDLVRRWHIPGTSGLGLFVAQSASAERARRRVFAVAASILVVVFAGIAALASLQWRRAEQQTVVARAAEATERDARAAADTARRDAERERDRADAERARALAALREARRSAARTLSAQAEIAAGRSEIHRALALAVEAGDMERDVLDPGAPSTSEPALLKALGDDREVLHLDRVAPGWHTLPHAFLDEERLVYADGAAGIMVADLRTGSTRQLAKLPENVLPLYVRAVPAKGLVAMASVKTLFLVDTVSGAARAQIAFPNRLSAFDVAPDGSAAVIGTGPAIAFVDLASPAAGEPIPVPTPREGIAVGQARFSPDGRRVLLGYGADILVYDRDAGAFLDGTSGDLTAGLPGVGRDFVEQVTAKGFVTPVDILPDPARDRFLLSSQMELLAVHPDGRRYSWDREPNEGVLGVGFVDQSGTGTQELVAMFGRRSDAGIDLRFAYVSDEAKPLTFETFRISAADLSNVQLGGCTLSPHASFVACSYNGKTNQGVFVFTVLGGRHRGSRLLSARGLDVSAIEIPGETPRLLVSGKGAGLTILPDGPVPGGIEWGDAWHLLSGEGAYAVATSTEGRIQILRADSLGSVRAVVPPMEGRAASLRAPIERALVVASDRLTQFDLASGRPVWSLPGLSGLRGAELSPDGSRAIAVTGAFAYAFDGRTGRIVSSLPLPAVPNSPVAADSGTNRIVFVAEDGPKLLDLATGDVRPLRPGKGTVTRLEWVPERGLILLGLDTGAIAALDEKGEPRWTIPPPADETFEVRAWPGQPPRGTLLDLVVSSGGRLAVLRQDMPSVALYDLATGQFLTDLTTPWPYGVPSAVSFDPQDRILTLWAVHPMVRANPGGASLHALPLGRERSLRAAQAALAATAPLAPDGSRAPLELSSR